MPDSPRLQQIRALLAADPRDPFLMYGLAMEHASLGDDAGAATAFDGLLAEHPDYVPAYLMLAQTHQRLAHDAEAVAALQRGIIVAQKAGDLHAVGELQGLLAIIE